MGKIIVIDTAKCTGCKVCELVCSLIKSGECNPGKSYIRVLRHKEMDFNMVALDNRCDFCSECVNSCLPDALKIIEPEEAIMQWKGVNAGSFPAPLLSGL